MLKTGVMQTLSKLAKAFRERKQNKKLLSKLKKMKPSKADALFQEAHAAVFEKTDCLLCANCCKTTSPVFTQHDIERISKNLKMKPKHFIATYLHRDAEDDFVLNDAPCTFLLDDNRCTIYDFRPKACREYPHTDRKKIQQLFSLTEKNLLICPAVVDIFDRIKQ